MKRLFVIDEHVSSKQNGIGTYMNSLFKCMDKEEIDFSLISYNEDNVSEFSISEEKDYTIYKFPVIAKGVFMENALLSLAILKRYIIYVHKKLTINYIQQKRKDLNFGKTICLCR